MKAGDIIQCVSGDYEGYGGTIKKVYQLSDQIDFTCSDCGNVHQIYISECELTKSVHKGHHLTKIFQ